MTSSSLNQPRILIVDDMPTNIRILAEVLHQEFLVQVATSGTAALKFIVENGIQPDLILLDVIMPEMDGYETCRRLKENEATKDIPIIFITSQGEEKDEEKGLNLGAVDYIIKPFSIPIVKSRIRNHITLKKRGDMLEQLANLDGLTGIPNRRCFDDIFAKELRRASRTVKMISMIMIDVDYFKNYNDNYGHGAGDDCLRRIAQGLSSVLLRAGDQLFRYGGEEFSVILPETDHDGALYIAKDFQQCIFAMNIQHDYSPIVNRITISMGCATIISSGDDNGSMLLINADQMLYQAKQQGRNRVCGIDLTVETVG